MMMRGLALAATAATLGLTACGFTPLYADHTGVSRNLADVRVVTGEGRVAYLLRQSLLDEFGARGGESAARYTLRTQDNITRRGLGIRVDDVATRYEIIINVAYELIDEEDGRTVKRGRVSAEASYDTPDQPFAEVAAEESARERAANLAAERLRTELSLHFADLKTS
jgi:LPS-assembly lipoprotein